MSGNNPSSRISLDASKISNNYKIVHYDYYYSPDEDQEHQPRYYNKGESEERVLANNGIKNALKYITSITLNYKNLINEPKNISIYNLYNNWNSNNLYTDQRQLKNIIEVMIDNKFESFDDLLSLFIRYIEGKSGVKVNII